MVLDMLLGPFLNTFSRMIYSYGTYLTEIHKHVSHNNQLESFAHKAISVLNQAHSGS